jgi:hypothetical protein
MAEGGEKSPPFLFCPRPIVSTICAGGRNDFGHNRLIAHLRQSRRHTLMNSIIYIVGLIVIVMAILSFIGLA